MASGAVDHSSQRVKTNIRQFKDKVQQYTLKGACNRHFLRTTALRRWWRQERRVIDLLEEAYPYAGEMALPIDASDLEKERNCSLLIFSILLELGHGAFIHCFYKRRLFDRNLPLKKVDILETYKTAITENRHHVDVRGAKAEDLAKLFDRKQYIFCPATFEHRHKGSYPEDWVLPIMIGHKSMINKKGGTASVYQVCVLDEFLDDELKKSIANAKFQGKDDDLGDRYRFAIKSFDHEKRSFFDAEVKAFEALRNHTGMVRFLGHFEHKMPNGKMSYHIMLEYGQLDLDEYFFTRDIVSPRLPSDVASFWGDMRNIAEAVKDVHLFRGPRQRDDISEYYGWHADIKPDNILRVDNTFKLADPGFATFKKVERSDVLKRRVKLTAQEEDDSTMIKGGTATYGAPECNYGKGERCPVSRSIDIWSLGCVFSVAATWVVLGPRAILEYHTVRQKFIKTLINQQEQRDQGQSSTQGQEGTSELMNSDCFHDGSRVLGIVRDWHKLLRKAVSGTDLVTSKMLDLIDEKMLLEDASKRIIAKDLCTEMNKILKQADADTIGFMPERVSVALEGIEITAPALPTQQELLLNENQNNHLSPNLGTREQRKSKLFPRYSSTATVKSIIQNSTVIAQDTVSPIPSLPKNVPEKVPTETAGLASLALPSSTRVPEFSVTAPGDDPRGSLTSTLQQQQQQQQQPPSSPPAQEHTVSLPVTRPSEKEETPQRTFTRSDTAGFYAAFPTTNQASLNLPKQTPWQARAELDSIPRSKFKTKFGLGKRPKKDPVLAERFKSRDLHFFVDNTISMRDKWDEVIWLLEILIGKSAGLDEDGMDLSFSNGSYNVRGKDGVEDFRAQMKLARPRESQKVDTSITIQLGMILADYREKLQQLRTEHQRKLTIIVLTDGIWEGMTDKTAVEHLITDNFEKMDRILDGIWPDPRQVTFQFIRFGFDVDATYRLQNLDDLMQYQYTIPDIIDTVDSRSDIYKMLLGSFVPEYDDHEVYALPHFSPTTMSLVVS